MLCPLSLEYSYHHLLGTYCYVNQYFLCPSLHAKRKYCCSYCLSSNVRLSGKYEFFATINGTNQPKMYQFFNVICHYSSHYICSRCHFFTDHTYLCSDFCLKRQVEICFLCYFPVDVIQSEHELPTLLHLSGEYGLEQLAVRLLDLPGATSASNVFNHHGRTASELARNNGYLELAKTLGTSNKVSTSLV